MAEKLFIASSPEEAVKAMSGEAAYMAGGTEVMRLGSGVSADSYVSVRRIPGMRTVKAGGARLSIGAACTFQELIDNDSVPAYLKEALGFMASRTRRNMATIGGNIAICRDDSFIIPALIAASAELSLMDADCGVRSVSLEDYISDREAYSGMLITDVLLPQAAAEVRSSRSANTAQSHARLTASLSFDGREYRACAAVKNSGIYVLHELSERLGGSDMSEDEIVAFVTEKEDIRLEDDLIYGSADYRRYLTGITFALLYEELKGKGGCEK